MFFVQYNTPAFHNGLICDPTSAHLGARAPQSWVKIQKFEKNQSENLRKISSFDQNLFKFCFLCLIFNTQAIDERFLKKILKKVNFDHPVLVIDFAHYAFTQMATALT